MKSFTEVDSGTVSERASKAIERAELEGLFDRLIARNGAAFRRLAATYTNTDSDRDDLLQEIALAIWHALPSFRGECSERTFAFRIAYNRSIAYISRAQSRRVELDGEMELQDPAPNAELDLLQQQNTGRLRRAIRRLPVGYQQVVTLMLEDLEYTEIAGVLGISEANVGARLTRARKMLRSEMENAG